MNISLKSLRAKAGVIAGCAALLATATQAQKPEARIVVPVVDSVRSTLTGTHPLIASAVNDAGRMSASAQIEGASMFIGRSPAQQSALDALVAAQQDPSSPQYHQWLGPDQFAAQFGAADADLAAVINWLQQQGFTGVAAARNRSVITFTGSVAQIEAAFGTEMHNYTVGGVKHYAPASDLTVPEALATAVVAVGNLNDFRPRSHALLRGPVSAKPNFTSSQTGSHFVQPGDVAAIYDINAAYNAGYTGVGQSIAVVGQSAVVTADITNFQLASGTPQRSPTEILMPGTGAGTIYSGDEAESDLDLEYTGAIARGASITFVYTGNSSNYGAFDALAYAVTNKTANIISSSYGECEAALGGASFNQYNASLQQAVAQGQTVISAAGDSGSLDCYGVSGETAAQETVLGVDFPASSQYVTGMGGSEYLAADVTSTSTQYWNTSTGYDVVTSALGYIPEQVWNDNSSTGGLSSGGGGASIFTPRPTWQTGVTGIPTGSFRLIPDISLASSPNNAGYLYCSSDTTTGITGSCSNGFRDVSDSNLTVAGGTSFAAPIFAGMLAIINQSKSVTTGAGLVNPTLYTLAANATTYASAFHDITSGNNGCTSGVAYPTSFSPTTGRVATTGPACPSADAGLFAATAGYDQASGLGSLDLNNLLTAWPGTAPVMVKKFTLAAGAVAITQGSSGTATFTVTPVNGYTGSVAFTLSSIPLISGACVTLTNASVSGTGTATGTATIYTTAANCPTGAIGLVKNGAAIAKGTTPQAPGQSKLPAEAALAGLLMAGLAGRRSRRVRGLVLTALLLGVAGFGLAGCGSGGSGTGVTGTTTTTTTGTGTTNSGVAAKGTYTLTATGSDTTSGQQAQTTFTLTVQ